MAVISASWWGGQSIVYLSIFHCHSQSSHCKVESVSVENSKKKKIIVFLVLSFSFLGKQISLLDFSINYTPS